MTAYIVLFSWPLVVAILFWRASPPVALIWSIVAGLLLLPTSTGIDFPLLPEINKHLIPSISALLMALIITRKRAGFGDRALTQSAASEASLTVLPGWLPRSYIVRILVLMLIVGAFPTTWLNGDNLVYGTRFLPRIGTYDAFSTAMNAIVGLVPFFLARKFLAHPDSHRTVLLILCIAGLLYSLPALYEIRMSPQLNKMVYGFFPHSWRQHIRGSGFRPLVFLRHGLLLGMFLSATVLAALGYFRTIRHERRWLFVGISIWLLMTLVLAKSLGALLITMALIPAVVIFGIRMQLLLAAAIAAIVLSYPVLRSADIIPVSQIITLVEGINSDRARSLEFRIENENILLQKASERPTFGWGKWGRSRVFDERGDDISVTDGYWIITIGEGGWTRYIAEFGLLTMSVFLLMLRRRRYEITIATSALALVLVANLLDLMVNSGLTPITWLMAGALTGRLELQKIGALPNVGLAEPQAVRTSRYSRPRPKAEPAQALQPAAKYRERLPYARQHARNNQTQNPT